jgi:LPS export ABC transporter permease LptG/LPS export ABC transporter permease LptF
MRRLDRYIFREVLVPALIALIALTFIVLSGPRRGGLLLEIIVRQSPTAAEVWSVIAALIPAVLIVTVPMALLVGILTGFGRLSSDSEAIAMRAAGVSMRRILRPVLVLSLLAWGLTQWLTYSVAPRTQAELRASLASLALKYPNIELRPRVFYERPGLPWVLWVSRSQTGNGIQSQGIILADMKDPERPDFTFAQSGSITPTNGNRSLQLSLVNGSTHMLCPPEPQAAQPPGCSSSDGYVYYSFSGTTFSRDLPEPPVRSTTPVEEVPTWTLWEHVRGGSASLKETIEFHQRFARPFACIAFALVGLPLGVSTRRGGRSTGLVLSLVLMFGYYMSLVGGTRATGAGAFSPIVGAWLPNIGFCTLGVFLLARSDRLHENRLIASVAHALQWVQGKLTAVKPRDLHLSELAFTLTSRIRFFKLIDSYVLRGFWFFFVIVLSVFAFLFITVTLFELLPSIIEHQIAVGTVIVYFIFLMPQIFFWVVPLAVLLAILINLGTLTKTNEILAVKAGAVSLYRLSLPIILMAAMLSGVVYVLQDYVLPWTNRRQDEYHDIIRGKAPQTYRDPYRKLMMGTGDLLYHYTFFDPNLSTFANLSILKLDVETFRVEERLFARRAVWNGRGWILEDGWQRKFSPDHKTHTEMFQRKTVFEMNDPSYFKREVREADQMKYAELQRYVEDLRRSGIDVGRLTVDLYRKVSFPMVTFIMALIGIPFSFKTGRKGAFYGIGLCLAVGILYWSTMELFGKLGGINQLSPFVAAWFPNIVFGAGGFWMMLRMKT